MRLIDADKLIESLYISLGVDRAYYGKKCDIDFDLVIQMVKNQKVIESEQSGEWIPCSERLPDKDGRYLVTSNDWDSYEVSWNIWLTNSAQWVYNVNPPIAWMEFPEAYRGDQDA